ncbi:MAG: Trk system potassium transporter TrkA [Kiritimatiellae bacterium]|nr:Trk system potassium transporter TrkA [Kiritimatiellia bacterium]
MRAVILGAGSAGSHLAARLCAEKYDVVLVDRQAMPLAELSNDLDILTIEGHGSNPMILERAGIREAEIFVAVTDSDDVNILACSIARMAGVKYKVARVSAADYYSSDRVFNLKAMGVDLAINPKEECAQELAYMVSLPGSQEVVDLFEGHVLSIGFKISADSPLLRCTLATCPEADRLKRVRFLALQRGDEVMIPHGDNRFMVGDDLFVIGTPDDLDALLEYAYPDRPKISKVVIAGGGGMGRSLARMLESKHTDLVLVESNPAIAESCSEALDRTLVLKGDIMSSDTLENAGITDETAFIATTGSDENNIIGCLLGQREGACLTIAKVSRPEYVPIINSLSLLDRAVNPHLSMVNAILHYVRGRSVRSAAILSTLGGELLEVQIDAGHAWVTHRIRDLRIPRGAIIAVIEREGRVLVPTGDTRLEIGDRLVIFCLATIVEELTKLLKAPA